MADENKTVPVGDDQQAQPDKAAQKKAEKERAKAERKAKAKEHKAAAAANGVTEKLAATSLDSGKSTAASKHKVNYDVGLKNTENGIVTRFPPEPSGYLHIGHAKAALLNDFFAHDFLPETTGGPRGKLRLRWDDTNPSKEKQEFQDAIKIDLELLGIKPDAESYTSDYFEMLYDYCIEMIKAGKAFADDTVQATMSEERRSLQPSRRRDESIEDNLARFKEMETGSDEGQRWCIRAKISFDHKNAVMRDPTIYRCNMTPHHRLGTRWKIYPLYDFACAIVDSKEGVTHALRTIEYHDHNELFDWLQAELGLRTVEIFDFSKLTFIKTVLSKRKLTKLVDMGKVTGWDDPRMPTVRGIRRRGMQIEALREFMVSQGPSKNIVLMDWFSIWTINKRVIDPIAARYTAVAEDKAVTCTLTGGPHEPLVEDKPKHMKSDLGTKKVWHSDKIIIDQEDAKTFAQDEEITLMNWGNAFVRKISKDSQGDVEEMELELHLEGDFKKTSKKVTWLSKHQKLVNIEMVDFAPLFTKDKLDDEDVADLENRKFLSEQTEFTTKAVADCNVADIKVDDVMQFDRKGYFRCDQAATDGSGAVFFQIPTGKSK